MGLNNYYLSKIYYILYNIALLFLYVIIFIYLYFLKDYNFFNFINNNLNLSAIAFGMLLTCYVYIIIYNNINKSVKNLYLQKKLLIINILSIFCFLLFIIITFEYHFEKFYKNPSTEFNIVGQLFKEISTNYKIQISERLNIFNFINIFEGNINIQKSKPYDINFIKPENLIFELTRLNILFEYNFLNSSEINYNQIFFLILICMVLPHLYKDYMLYNECLKNYNYNYLKRFIDPNLNFYTESNLTNLVIDKYLMNKNFINFPYEISLLYEPNKDALFFTEYLDIIYPKNISVTYLVDITLYVLFLYFFIFLNNNVLKSIKLTKNFNKILFIFFKFCLFILIFFYINIYLLTPFIYLKQSISILIYLLACFLYLILGFLWFIYLYLIYIHIFNLIKGM